MDEVVSEKIYPNLFAFDWEIIKLYLIHPFPPASHKSMDMKCLRTRLILQGLRGNRLKYLKELSQVA